MPSEQSEPRFNTSSPTVVVTGASSGIGMATALRYATRGARLVLASRSLDRLERVADQCRAAGASEVLCQVTNISDELQVEALMDAAWTVGGGPDIVVQCAAVAAFGRFAEVPSGVFDEIVHTNVCGAANAARSALAHFTRSGSGQLVLVGSLLGQVAVPYMAPYVVSKFAVSALVRVLRQENRDPAVAIHGIYPGAVTGPIYGSAATYTGRVARVPPFIADEPRAIARAILRATDEGRPSERSVGPVNWAISLAYTVLPTVFDAIIGPAMRMGGFTQEVLAATTGNLFTTPGNDAGESRPDDGCMSSRGALVDAQP